MKNNNDSRGNLDSGDRDQSPMGWYDVWDDPISYEEENQSRTAHTQSSDDGAEDLYRTCGCGHRIWITLGCALCKCVNAHDQDHQLTPTTA